MKTNLRSAVANGNKFMQKKKGREKIYLKII
jgi:hypothetical protein